MKIGAGVVGGLIVGGAAGYLAKPSTSSTTTSTETETSTATAPPTTVTSTTSEAASTVTSSVTSTATSTLTGSTVTSTVTSPPQTSTVTSTETTTVTSTGAASSTGSTFLTLNYTEQAEMAAIASAIIPTDSNGPGATEAGVAYFIDHQLQGEYGTDGSVFTDGPWVPANESSPVTVGGVTYSGATVNYDVAGTTYTVVYPPTANVRVGAGTRYQYPLSKRDFWRVGLAGIEAYSNAAYGANFEKLSAANQTACLTDLWSNKPTAQQFQGILPSDFAYELFFLTWAGFLMDPAYGGNQNMVGWSYVAFNGVNMGNFFGEGYTTQQLMLATTPTALKPVSLGMFQQAQSGSSGGA